MGPDVVIKVGPNQVDKRIGGLPAFGRLSFGQPHNPKQAPHPISERGVCSKMLLNLAGHGPQGFSPLIKREGVYPKCA